MQKSFLRFYVHEGQRHGRRLVWEWLLEQAHSLGVHRGSAFRAMAGFCGHHVPHESSFFELAGTLAVEVEFIVTQEQVEQLLERVQAAGIRVMYATIPAAFGVINPDGDPAHR
jgi:uncharacterized protein